MSAYYECVQTAALYPDAFHVTAPDQAVAAHVWPRKPGFFIRHASGAEGACVPEAQAHGEAAADATDEPLRELVNGQFGLVPAWVKSASDAKLRATKLVNARSEILTTSTNFRDAWLKGQRCIVPMMAFHEDDWRTGKAVPTRIARIDGKPMGVAGIWERWAKDGEEIISFALLTVNANSHALLHRYQTPGSEKRMPAILGEGSYDAWLKAPVDKAKEFMRAYSATLLTANPVQKGPPPAQPF